VQVEIVESKME